ncbi:hypothetical protein N7488_003663 [Penicillium malachiteum]|nr:hypothetical protein N7488_003663 [Penicillium malachiteum]
MYDDEYLDGFYLSPSTFPCDIPYASAEMPMSTLGPSACLQIASVYNIPSESIELEDPARLTVPGSKYSLYNDTTADRESNFSWSTSTFSVTESPQPSPRDASISPSPLKERDDLLNYGVPTEDGWRCSFPTCNSKTTFQRGCDLRKHYKRHSRHLFCRYSSCPKSGSGGFSSKKDRARHEARHNPSITCEWEGCKRVFSRMDNMRDHLRRVHHKQARRAR